MDSFLENYELVPVGGTIKEGARCMAPVLISNFGQIVHKDMMPIYNPKPAPEPFPEPEQAYPKPPIGYEIVKFGDIIKQGYILFIADESNDWVKGTGICNNLIAEKDDDGYFANPIPSRIEPEPEPEHAPEPDKTLPTPPEGYVLVKNGEIIKEGYICRPKNGGEWINGISVVGYPALNNDGNYYANPIQQQPQEPEPEPEPGPSKSTILNNPTNEN